MRGRSGRNILTGLLFTVAIMMVMIFITTVIGGSLMKFLGMRYDSFGSVFLFFVIYFVVDYPVDLLVEALPKALWETGRLSKKRSETFLYIALDIPANCLVLLAIDWFFASVELPFVAILGFSIGLCAVNLYLSRDSLGGGEPVRVFLCEKAGATMPESRQLLLDALKLYCADHKIAAGPQELRIEEGEHGKPYALCRVKDQWLPHKNLHFSVSHTAHWWLCAVYDSPIGADIEEVDRKVNFDVAERFFSPSENRWLERAGRTREHFLELWVRKEAYVKYLGTGLAEGLQSFSVVTDGARQRGAGNGSMGTVQEREKGAGSRGDGASHHGSGGFCEFVGKEGRQAFCMALFPGEIRDPDEYPVPLVGAFCTEKCPGGLDIGFLEGSSEINSQRPLKAVETK